MLSACTTASVMRAHAYELKFADENASAECFKCLKFWISEESDAGQGIHWNGSANGRAMGDQAILEHAGR